MSLPPLSGDTEGVTAPADLIGRLVTLQLTNGMTVAVARILGVSEHNGAPRLEYRLPAGTAANSAVEVASLAHVHVYPVAVEGTVLLDPGGQVHVASARTPRTPRGELAPGLAAHVFYPGTGVRAWMGTVRSRHLVVEPASPIEGAPLQWLEQVKLELDEDCGQIELTVTTAPSATRPAGARARLAVERDGTVRLLA